MKKLICLSLFFAFATMGFAQKDADDYYKSSQSKLLAKDRVSAFISMGAGVSFLNTTKGSAFTTFVAPQIAYQLTQNFKLNLGLMHYSLTGNTSMPLNQQETFINVGNQRVTGNLVSLGGEYKLNKRLIVSGAVLMDANGFNTNEKNNYKAASLGLEYKTSEHTSIKFQTTISEGQGNLYTNPNPSSASGFNSLGTGFSNEMNSTFYR